METLGGKSKSTSFVLVNLTLTPFSASKFLTINVTKAKSIQAARSIAFSVANSPLIKTAVAGEDPNWGRVVMAIGKAGEDISIKNLRIKFGEFVIVEDGKEIEKYDEKLIKEYMQWDSIDIEINLNLGAGSFTVYTCDFTKDYVDINANYRN